MTRTQQAHTLAAVTAVAGILQFVATLELSLASDAAILRAIREGPGIYLIAATSLALALAFVVWQHHRSLQIRVAIALPGVIVATLIVALFGTRTGLAYHGELILHHFLAAISGAICLVIPVAWARDREHGPLRLLPIAPAFVGTGLLLAEHLQRPPGATISLFGQVGTVSLLLSAPLALACLWPRLQPPAFRVAALVLLAPLALRLALGGSDALRGLPLGTDAAEPLLIVIGITLALALFLVRPRAESGLHGLALALAALASIGLHRTYTQRFGELEVALGGLARSLLGFDPPYPTYLPAWRLIAAMLVLFVLLASCFAMILSQRDHQRGLCLLILLIAGLGMTSPQLVLMSSAGLLLILDSLHGVPPPPPHKLPAPRPVEAILAETAHDLGFPPPLVLEQERGAVISLRGQVGQTPIDLRARQDRHGDWSLILQTGVLGRGTPDFELRPGTPPEDSNPLIPAHRVRGDARYLERMPEDLLATLAFLPSHHTRVWSGGTKVELGGRLEALSVTLLASLIRGMSELT